MNDQPKTPGGMMLACPFCGCKETEDKHDDGYCWTECMRCHATGPGGTKYSDEESPSWNTRAMVEQAPAVGGDLSKDHVFRELVNALRDTAKKYSQTEQLRERISAVLRGHVAASESAARTLGSMGYTNNGGEFWKPPIGERSDFSMMDRLHARIAELEAQQVEAASFVKRLCESAAGQPSVATGYLRDILDVLESRSKLNP